MTRRTGTSDDDPRGVPVTPIDSLLVTAGRGDAEALASLYDRTVPLIHGLVRGVVPDEGTAEQVTRDIYLHTWRTAPTYDPVRSSAVAVLLASACRRLSELGHPPPSGPWR